MSSPHCARQLRCTRSVSGIKFVRKLPLALHVSQRNVRRSTVNRAEAKNFPLLGFESRLLTFKTDREGLRCCKQAPVCEYESSTGSFDQMKCLVQFDHSR